MRLHRAAVSFVFLACSTSAATAQSQTWQRQFGWSVADTALGAAQDGLGGSYVCGRTYGTVGAASAGNIDAWLARYDSSGTRTWIQQFGTIAADQALAAAPDASNGVYVVGDTLGSLGGASAGNHDAWLARYDGTGAQLWIRQLGTSGEDHAAGAASDGSGDVYVVGYTSGSLGAINLGANDAWVARYDASGNQTWLRQIGTYDYDGFYAAAPDGAGGVFAGGYSFANAWLVHFDGLGTSTWSQSIWSTSGTFESVSAAAPDGSGGVYIGGSTDGNLAGANAGGTDAWVARYDPTGSPMWVRQLGTSGVEWTTAAAVDPSGGVYVGGQSNGALGGASAGWDDGWLARFDSAGNQSWIRQFGTSGTDRMCAAASAGPSGVFVAGRTNGSYSGGSNFDVWVLAYDVPCGASFSYCTAGVTSNGCVPSISGTGAASASANSGFAISVAGVEGQKQGLIFYGIDNTGFLPAPWGGGASFLCIKSPLQRTLAQSSGGTLGQCDGALALDWNAFRAANPSALGAPFAAGQLVYAQGWFRDPPSAKTTNLSNGLQFSLCP